MRYLLTLCVAVLLAVGLVLTPRLDDPPWAATAPSFAPTPILGRIQLLNGTGAYAIAAGAATVTNTLAAYTCGATGSKITGMLAASNDSAARDLTVFMVPASNVPYILTTVTIPITAGQVAGTPPVNLLSPANMPGLPIDSDGNPYLLCQTGDVIRVGIRTTAVTANLAVTVLTIGNDF